MSISLLDMRYICGLPILGEPYEECILDEAHMKVEADYLASLDDLYDAYASFWRVIKPCIGPNT